MDGVAYVHELTGALLVGVDNSMEKWDIFMFLIGILYDP